MPRLRLRLDLLLQLRQPVAVVKAGHPVLVEPLLVLLVELQRAARHQALRRHGVRGVAQRLGAFHAVAIQFRQQLPQRALVGVRFDLQFRGKAVGPELRRLRRRAHLQQAHMQAVVALVHPGQRGSNRLRRHQDAQALAAQGPLDGAAPCALGGRHLDQLGDEGQGVFLQAQLVGQLRAKLLELRRHVGARALAHGLLLVLQRLQPGALLVLLGDGVLGGGLQALLARVQLDQGGRGLRLVLGQRGGAKLLRPGQLQLARQCLVLLRMGLALGDQRLLRGQFAAQVFNAGAAGAQVERQQLLLLLARGLDLLLGGGDLRLQGLQRGLQITTARAPQLHAQARKPGRQQRLQVLLRGQGLGLLALLGGQLAQRQQRQVLPVGHVQLGVDAGQLVKAGGHLQRIVKGAVVVKHQLAKNLVDAVELLESRRAVEQREGVGAHLKKALHPRQVRAFAAENLQAVAGLLQP